jgi:hypothetical protein
MIIVSLHFCTCNMLHEQQLVFHPYCCLPSRISESSLMLNSSSLQNVESRKHGVRSRQSFFRLQSCEFPIEAEDIMFNLNVWILKQLRQKVQFKFLKLLMQKFQTNGPNWSSQPQNRKKSETSTPCPPLTFVPFSLWTQYTDFFSCSLLN